MARLYTATLQKNSPRYEDWHAILQSDEVPIITPRPSEASLGGQATQVYKVDLDRLEKPQLERLLGYMVDRFGLKKSAAFAELESNGFPIREADVAVSFDLRAFITEKTGVIIGDDEFALALFLISAPDPADGRRDIVLRVIADALDTLRALPEITRREIWQRAKVLAANLETLAEGHD
jgi:hypothetical protein